MTYGNNGDTFILSVGGGKGAKYLCRNGDNLQCRYGRTETWYCGDWCSVFHMHKDGNTQEVHLCCCTPTVVIRIKEIA